MKNTFLLLSSFFLMSLSLAQESANSNSLSKYKFTVSGGITALNPEEINDHISTSNTVFNSATRTIKSAPEFSATFSMRPLRDDKVFLLRAGYISLERVYQVSIPETIDTTIITGYSTGSIVENYTVYPLSIGIGLASKTFETQIQLEFIFGLGYIEEEGNIQQSNGRRTAYRRSLFSPGYGVRAAANTTLRLSDRAGVTFEIGYRGLSFNEYEDETSTQSSNIKFSYSGVNILVGLSIIY